MFPSRIRADGRGLKIRFAAHASFLFRASSLLHERSVSDETCTPARLASSSHWRDEWNMKVPEDASLVERGHLDLAIVLNEETLDRRLEM